MDSASSRFGILTLLVSLLIFLNTAWAISIPPAIRDTVADAKKRPKKKPAEEDQYTEEETYFSYVSRPDLRSIRWDIDTVDKDALSPGYWFLAPYAALEQDEYTSWNGPCIYDMDGELVWSGAPMFHHLNMYDFRLAQINGEMLPTLIFTEHANGLILDQNYNINQTVDMFGMELPQWLLDQIGHHHTTNMHDFNVIDDGKRAVMLTKVYENATIEESRTVGFNGECTAKYQGFKEVDVATSEILFDWNSHGHIELAESTYKPEPLSEMCNGNAGPGGWDIQHLNSIDKFPDGDYLLSSRHTNTLYKVSHKDKSIVWRLKAEDGDFEFLNEDAKFRRQHHARVISQNETHAVVSVFNNARGTGKGERALGEFSTGLLLSLRTDTTPMTADVVAKFDRPGGKYTAARGSVQMLDGGNAFVGWSKHSLISEHASDGRLLQSAQFRHLAANTYRAYKYEWVGKPLQPPDVHSAATESGDDEVSTIVFVSWNGDTETKSWNLYKTNPDGESRELIGSTLRQGFESMISYKGYAAFVIVEAVDANGNVIGTSRLAETLPPGNLISADVAAEAQWLQDHSNVEQPTDMMSAVESPVVAYILGVASCAITVLAVVLLLRARQRNTGISWLRGGRSSYARVGEKDLDEGDFSEDTVVEEMSDSVHSTKPET